MTKNLFHGHLSVMNLVVLVILMSHFLLTQQTCKSYKQSLEMCYQTQDSNFIFVNCTQTTCSNNNASNTTNVTGNNTDCKVTNYNEVECLAQLCPQNTFVSLSMCINDLEGKSSFSNKTVEIVCSVVGAIVGVSVILLLSYFLYRKYYLPKTQKNLYHPTKIINRGFQNGFMPSLIDTSIVDMQQVSSKVNSPRTQKNIKIHSHSVENDPVIIQMGYVKNQIINQPCCICLSNQQINSLTECNHFYHANCISEWMKKQQSCPKCRSKNFTPIKIFCVKCGKIRDFFKFHHKKYVCFSKIDPAFYTTLTLCNKCNLSQNFQHEYERKIKENEIKFNIGGNQ